MKDLEQSRTEQVAKLISGGMSPKEIAEYLGINKSNASGHATNARGAGLIRPRGDKD